MPITINGQPLVRPMGPSGRTWPGLPSDHAKRVGRALRKEIAERGTFRRRGLYDVTELREWMRFQAPPSEAAVLRMEGWLAEALRDLDEKVEP